MFSNLFPPVVSGSATQSSFLSHQLAARGHHVSVITARVSPDAPAKEIREGVEIHRLPALRLPALPIALNFPWLSYTFTPANLARIRRILAEHPPDVLHLHNHMFDLAFSTAIMSRWRRVPFAVTIHTMIQHARPGFNALLRPVDRLVLGKLVVRRAGAVLCPDVNIQEYVFQAFGRRDAAIVPYGISLPATAPAARIEELRSQHGLADHRVILSLGHVHEIRNRKELVAAMPRVLGVVPNALLLIVGAVATETPARLARDLGIESAVRLIGPVPHADVPALLALAELEAHWLNQDVPEKTSLGIASLEAMSVGKTVLAAASEMSYGPGVLRQGDNVVLVRPESPDQLADEIIGLLLDPERRRRIGDRARQTIREHFGWDTITAKTLGHYQAMIDSVKTGK
jgi:glycosyltransferase involved in cell wall biosynthesis